MPEWFVCMVFKLKSGEDVAKISCFLDGWTMPVGSTSLLQIACTNIWETDHPEYLRGQFVVQWHFWFICFVVVQGFFDCVPFVVYLTKNCGVMSLEWPLSVRYKGIHMVAGHGPNNGFD
jgi:hypothetical protein